MNRSAIIYTSKILCGIIIVYFLSAYLNYTDFIWCLISVILVTSPEGKDAMNLVRARIKANLIGAAAGMIFLWLGTPLLLTLCGAVILTIAVCYLLKLIDPMRAALAATIIITLHPENVNFWTTAVERILSVLAGCLIALAITFIFHRSVGWKKEDAKSSEG